MDPIAPVLPTVIGIAGRKGSGKDSVANHLVSMYGFVRVAFADPIKAGVAAMFEVDNAFLEQRENKERALEELVGYSPRFIWQTLGTEWGRRIVGHDLWVRLAQKKLAKLRDAGSLLVVVPDVRFSNEVEFLHSIGGTVWWVERTVEQTDTHASEVSIDSTYADTVIYNNDTFEMLYAQIGVTFANLRRQAIFRAFKDTAV